ncbi:MAG: thermonuclease family protein [Rickettsiales bacterium]|jgi:endonuclease YncB( thermonuclease family)|nr:thermonuclease family protein [Rickettsiales bacterium]
MKKYYIIFTIFLLTTSHIYGQRGCCSHHGGVGYCDANNGRIVCRDQTYSPSCICEKNDHKIITGKVVKVTDGDTITVLNDYNEQIKIRLYGIDSPETKQDYGNKSKEFLANLIAGKNIEVKQIDIDRYKRVVGIIDNVNIEMIRSGHAWYYKEYCKLDFCNEWEELEKQAKENKMGLWKQKNPIKPREFRSKNKSM